MAKKIDVQKEPVKLREKVLKKGSISLFIDIYSNGRWQKQYLKLYLIKATTQALVLSFISLISRIYLSFKGFIFCAYQKSLM